MLPGFSPLRTAQFLAACSASGWAVVGADASDKAVSCRDFPALSRPTLLVLGSEGKGLRTAVRRVCESLIRIPGSEAAAGGLPFDAAAPRGSADADDGSDDDGAEGAFGGDGGEALDSLNVSVAAGILMFALAGGRS